MNQKIGKPLNDINSNTPAQKISLKQKILGTIFIFITSFLYAGIYKTAPAFVETFHAFGAHLPAITIFFTTYYVIFIWLSVLSFMLISFLIIEIFNKNYALFILKINKFNLLFSILCLLFFMVAMYIPVFQLKSAQ